MRAKPEVLAAYLDDAEADLELAEAGIQIENRHAVFHVQQAAEKLVKAVRLHRGLLATKEHRIGVLVDGAPAGEPSRIPEGDPWRVRLLSLEPLSDYATTFRYPSPTGKLKSAPDKSELTKWVATVRELLADARTELIGG